MTNQRGAIVLEPYNCIAKRSPKYALDCTEVYLANLGATEISDNFSHFTNLEIIWFNGNRLARLEHLESNFRIKEVNIQDNRIVSLHGLKSLKFLRVLCASNNQIQNLDKQLALLARFSFLKKLDLFGNPIAQEPDYRSRVIYHVPQVEILDRQTVKLAERQRADDAVPNANKIAMRTPIKELKSVSTLSRLERDCFQQARSIGERRRVEEDADLGKMLTRSKSLGALQIAKPKTLSDNIERWTDPRVRVQRGLSQPSPWEKLEMLACIEKLADKEEPLSRVDVTALCAQLAKDGIPEVGRFLGNPPVFASFGHADDPASASEDGRQLDSRPSNGNSQKGGVRETPQGVTSGIENLFPTTESTACVQEVAECLLKLEWPLMGDEALDEKINKLQENLNRAELAGDAETSATCRNAIMRLEGVRTRKHDVGLVTRAEGGPLRKTRMDVFSNSLLRPRRAIDEQTGKMGIKVSMHGCSTHLGV